MSTFTLTKSELAKHSSEESDTTMTLNTSINARQFSKPTAQHTSSKSDKADTSPPEIRSWVANKMPDKSKPSSSTKETKLPPASIDLHYSYFVFSGEYLSRNLYETKRMVTAFTNNARIYYRGAPILSKEYFELPHHDTLMEINTQLREYCPPNGVFYLDQTIPDNSRLFAHKGLRLSDRGNQWSTMLLQRQLITHITELQPCLPPFALDHFLHQPFYTQHNSPDIEARPFGYRTPPQFAKPTEYFSGTNEPKILYIGGSNLRTNTKPALSIIHPCFEALTRCIPGLPLSCIPTELANLFKSGRFDPQKLTDIVVQCAIHSVDTFETAAKDSKTFDSEAERKTPFETTKNISDEPAKNNNENAEDKN